MKNWWKDHWKLVVILISLALVSIIGVNHNQLMYRQPIGKILTVKTVSRQKQKDEFNNVDYQYKQRLTLRIMNGRHRGKQVQAINSYSQSGGMDQHYRVGQQVFLTQLSQSHGSWHANVTGLKRDSTVVILIWVVIALVILLFQKAGSFAFVSVILNVVLFIGAVKMNVQTQANYLLPIFAAVAFLMALVTLTFVYGWNKQTMTTLVASLIGVTMAMIIFIVVSQIMKLPAL